MKITINMDSYPEINKDKFLASNPTLIARSTFIDFYEDPIHGDEAGLVAVFDSQCRVTDLYDIPDQDEIFEWFVNVEHE